MPMPRPSPSPALALLVLRCNDLDGTKRFFEAIGLSWTADMAPGRTIGPAGWTVSCSNSTPVAERSLVLIG